MGFFSGSKERHRVLLADASRLLMQYTRAGDFDLSTIPIEFHSALLAKLESLRFHTQRTEAELGDADIMRELAEELTFSTLIASGKVSKETQRNFRTETFNHVVEYVAELVGRPERRDGDGRPSSLGDVGSRLEALKAAIRRLELVLDWNFSERPPDYGKHTFVEANMLLATARQTYESRLATYEASGQAAGDACAGEARLKR